MKMNYKVCKCRTISLPAITALSFAVGFFLLISVVAATVTTSPSQQQAFAQQTSVEAELGSVLKLARTNVPIDIPLLNGYENGNEIYFIATDVSDEKTAAFATNLTGFKVNYAPALAQTPDSARAQAYAFTNGVAGDGPFGYQIPVVNAKPGDEGYSPLWQVNEVTWNDNATARELKSIQEITYCGTEWRTFYQQHGNSC